MHKEYRRKPNRKSIIRKDDSGSGHDRVEHSRQRRSTSIKKSTEQPLAENQIRARVVSAAGNTWFVVVDSQEVKEAGEYSDTIECHIGGLALTENDDDTLVCVGDYVQVVPSESQVGKGVIVAIEKRRTRLIRKTAGERPLIQCIASNVDQCVIVCAAAEPFYNKRLIDRYLISAEQGSMKPALVINKSELMPEDFVREDLQCYTDLGIPLVICSCKQGTGLEELKNLFSGKTSMLAGPSGVGKSSIVNACFGVQIQDVREISTKYDKGKHTTTSARIFSLGDGAQLVDTPGIREFGITDIHIEDLSYAFHDFDNFYQNCRFLPCTHTHEPDCAVKAAVEQGLIDAGRYESYLRIRESME